MPKTYTATEVEEIVRECLGKGEKHTKNPTHENEELWCCLDCYDDGQRNALRTLALERLEKRLKEDK